MTDGGAPRPVSTSSTVSAAAGHQGEELVFTQQAQGKGHIDFIGDDQIKGSGCKSSADGCQGLAGGIDVGLVGRGRAGSSPGRTAQW